MDAHKALIQDIFNNGTLIEVPFFQRSYVWKDDLWQRLLDDSLNNSGAGSRIVNLFG